MELLQPQKPPEPHSQTLNSPENPSSQSFPKKTRDLPNLTECHSCGFKVDVCTTGGKNALRTLYSEWRVVLLCNKCFYKVKSSQICSYCFSIAFSQECFRCIQCRNSVHKNCFFKHKDAAPWSYACLGSEFSVCVDCWIPKPLANHRRRMRKVRGGRIEKKGGALIEKGNARVSGGGNLVRSMVDVVNDANRAVEKKVQSASGAREEVVKKAVVAKRAVEKANNALSLVAKPNGEEGGRNPRRRMMDAVRVFDGSELTFELHPYMSCSRRISKSRCLLNTGYLDTSKRSVSSDDSSCKTSNSGSAGGCDEDEVSGDDKLNEDSYKSSFVSIESSDSDSSTDLTNLCIGRSDAKTSSKDEEELLKEGEGSCSDRLINFAGEDNGLELDRKQADSALHGEERCSGQCDRYFLKYMRKNYRFKANLDSKPRILPNKTGVPFSFSRESKDDTRITELDVKEDLLKEREGSCSHRLISSCGEYSGLELGHKQAGSALHREERCDGQCDQYFLKYSRKKYRLKTDVDSKLRILHDKIVVPFSCSRISKDGEQAVSNVEEEVLKEGEGSCSYRLINFGGEHNGLELDCKQADSALHREKSCDGQRDRYFLKYRRKKYRLKTNVDSKHRFLHDKIGVSLSCSWESKDDERIAELDVGKELLKEGERSCSYRLINFGEEDSDMELDRKQADSAFRGEERCNGQHDRYFLKYRRRLRRLKASRDSKPQAFHDKIYLESQDSAVGVSFSCSRELRTLSNASSQSFHAPLQSSACEHGYISESHTLEGNRELTML